jgi:hypothetical protein
MEWLNNRMRATGYPDCRPKETNLEWETCYRRLPSLGMLRRRRENGKALSI